VSKREKTVNQDDESQERKPPGKKTGARWDEGKKADPSINGKGGKVVRTQKRDVRGTGHAELTATKKRWTAE